MSSTATTPSAEELRTLSEQAQTFLPQAADRQPSGFLSLAPTTSASYPQPKKTPTTAEGIALAATKRRSSSQSTSTSDSAKAPQGLRFLKLGPVHWGEHLGENQADWHEVAIE